MSEDNELIDNLRSDSPRTRREAAMTLGKRKVMTAIDPLIERLSDDDPSVKEASMRALMRISGAQTVRRVAPLLHDASPGVRSAIVEVLQKTARDHADEITSLLRDDDKDIRKFATDILAYIGDDSCRTEIEERLSDADSNVRCAAAETLAKLNLHDSAGRILDQLTRETQPWVRFHLLQALARIGDIATVDGLLQMDETSAVCMEAIVEVLGAVGEADQFARLLTDGAKMRLAGIASMLRASVRIAERTGDSDPMNRLANDPELKATICKLLTDADEDSRLAAREFLAQSGSGSNLDWLLGLVADGESEIRTAALRALVCVRREELRDFLVGMFDDPDSDVLVEGIRMLARLRGRDCYDEIMARLGRESRQVQLAIGSVLHEAGVPDALTMDMTRSRDVAMFPN